MKLTGKTYAELLSPAMEVQTPEAAQEHLAAYIERMKELHVGDPLPEAQWHTIAMQNIGYYAGYYDKETYERVMRLYGTEHPYFGATYPDGRWT